VSLFEEIQAKAFPKENWCPFLSLRDRLEKYGTLGQVRMDTSKKEYIH